jgi:predicted Zn-dependent peptidase
VRGPAAARLLLLGALASPAAAQTIPDHPDKLTFRPLVYTPPSAKAHRAVLRNGIVVFIGEDRALPLVTIAATIRTGAYMEPPGKEGLAGFTGMLMRRGGTRSLTAEQFDERLDFLAAQVASGIGETAGSASLNCLADNLDESLRLFVEMLRHPRIQEDRLKLAQQQALQELQKRNDDAGNIEAREWGVLLYGEQHYSNRFTTEASLRGLTRDDLLAFHQRYYYPANMVLAVSGAFTRADMLRRLEASFGGWPSPRTRVPPPPPEISPAPPGLYRVQKDVNQGRVSLGLPSVKRDHPDVYALELMNEILGGSGFTSRITRTVRSNEGLAYSAGSGLSFGIYHPGRFRAGFQSKSRSVAYATQLVLEEIRRIREEPVSGEELDTIQRNLIETFTSNFAGMARAMAVFAADEYTGRDPSYWATYRDRIRAVTAADIQRVAREHLVPEKMRLLVVGDQKEIDLGDGVHDAKLVGLAPGSNVVSLPLRDPLTMKPLAP